MDDDRNFRARVRELFEEFMAEREASVLGDPDVSSAAKSAAGQQLGKRSAARRKLAQTKPVKK